MTRRPRKAAAKRSVRRRTLAGYQPSRDECPPRRPDVRPDRANPA